MVPGNAAMPGRFTVVEHKYEDGKASRSNWDIAFDSIDEHGSTRPFEAFYVPVVDNTYMASVGNTRGLLLKPTRMQKGQYKRIAHVNNGPSLKSYYEKALSREPEDYAEIKIVNDGEKRFFIDII